MRPARPGCRSPAVLPLGTGGEVDEAGHAVREPGHRLKRQDGDTLVLQPPGAGRSWNRWLTVQAGVPVGRDQGHAGGPGRPANSAVAAIRPAAQLVHQRHPLAQRRPDRRSPVRASAPCRRRAGPSPPAPRRWARMTRSAPGREDRPLGIGVAVQLDGHLAAGQRRLLGNPAGPGKSRRSGTRPPARPGRRPAGPTPPTAGPDGRARAAAVAASPSPGGATADHQHVARPRRRVVGRVSAIAHFSAGPRVGQRRLIAKVLRQESPRKPCCSRCRAGPPAPARRPTWRRSPGRRYAPGAMPTLCRRRRRASTSSPPRPSVRNLQTASTAGGDGRSASAALKRPARTGRNSAGSKRHVGRSGSRSSSCRDRRSATRGRSLPSAASHSRRAMPVIAARSRPPGSHSSR